MRPLAALSFCIPFLALSASAASAQLAKVTSVQKTVEVRSGASVWNKARVGTALETGDMVRTGRRSKADIKFGDGSLIRLGQLSSVDLRGGHDVRLTAGALLVSALNPGSVMAGSAVGEIKGTVFTVEVSGKDAKFTLYEGAMDVVTPKQRQPLAAGQEIWARPDGTLSGLRAAAPLYFSNGAAPSELLDQPKSTPFVGSQADRVERGKPDRVAAKELDKTEKIAKVGGKGKGKGPGEKDKLDPYKDNKGPRGGRDDEEDDSSGPGGGDDDNSGPGNGDDLTQALKLGLARNAAPLGGGSATIFNAPAVGRSGQSNSTVSGRVLLAQLPPPATTSQDATTRDAVRAADVANDAATGGQYLSERAQQRLRELAGNRGKTSGGDVRLLGVLGDSGTRAYGARIHGYVARGNFLLDAAVQPLRVRAGGQRFDLSAVSDLSLTYRNKAGEAQVGRQRFLAGPTQATLFGSLVRQGGREIMDAARLAPRIGDDQSLELAYLFDAYPHNLPYRVSGRQRGFYARYSAQKKVNFGFNLLRYTNAPVSSVWGGSVDFALPLLKNQVDLYGELGRDTFKRRLSTLGLSFPGIYDKTGFDLYLEYANVGSSSLAARPPIELALRGYRKLNDNLDIVVAASRFYGQDTTFTLGLSAGSRVEGR